MIDIVEHVGGGLVDRRGARAGYGVRLRVEGVDITRAPEGVLVRSPEDYGMLRELFAAPVLTSDKRYADVMRGYLRAETIGPLPFRRLAAAHPQPVVLLHGVFQNQNMAWQALAPTLANDGYCVYTMTYGQTLYSGNLGAIGDGPWAMLDDTGELLAVYEATGSDRIRPAVVLAEQTRPGAAGSSEQTEQQTAKLIDDARRTAVQNSVQSWETLVAAKASARAYPRCLASQAAFP